MSELSDDNNNNSSSSSNSNNDAADAWQWVVTWLNNVGIPLVCAFGASANVLCMLAYWRTTLRVQSSSFYLVCLAAVHLLYIARYFVSWLEHLALISTDNVVACPLLAYAIYVLTFSSAWILVALTTERLIIVYFPQRRQSWCKKKTSRTVVITILVVACVLYTFCFATTGLEQHGGIKMCAPLERFDHITQKIRYLDSIITFLFPSAIIIAFDIAIGYKVRDYICHRSSSTLEDRRQYNLELEISEQSTMLRTCSEHTQLCQRQTNSVRSRSVCEYHRPAINETLKQDFHLRSTRAFLWASVCYLVLYLPINIVNFVMIANELFGADENYSDSLFYIIHILHFVSFVNFGSTCFLFWCRNRSSRRALLRLFKLKTWNLSSRLQKSSLPTGKTQAQKTERCRF